MITGFGRTGPMFACETMGAVPVPDRMYQSIADAVPDGTLFGHDPTRPGHPVSAAVGLGPPSRITRSEVDLLIERLRATLDNLLGIEDLDS